jgi:hypothetical protein
VRGAGSRAEFSDARRVPANLAGARRAYGCGTEPAPIAEASRMEWRPRRAARGNTAPRPGHLIALLREWSELRRRRPKGARRRTLRAERPRRCAPAQNAARERTTGADKPRDFCASRAQGDASGAFFAASRFLLAAKMPTRSNRARVGRQAPLIMAAVQPGDTWGAARSRLDGASVAVALREEFPRTPDRRACERQKVCVSGDRGSAARAM